MQCTRSAEVQCTWPMPLAFGGRGSPAGFVAAGWRERLKSLLRTERTTEQQDSKVREVLIQLEAGAYQLPIGLQMTVRFLAAESS